MARKLRIQFEGAIYHVTIRGVERGGEGGEGSVLEIRNRGVC